MAIQIGGTTVINNSRNITNVGIITVGTGGTSGILHVGTGATIFGSGNVSIAGTLYAFDIVTPLKIDSFSPSNGSTNNPINTDIRITFAKAIGIGSTGFVRIESGSGSFQDVYGVGSTYISRVDVNRTLVITPSQDFVKGVPGAVNTVTTIIDASVIDDPSFTGINTTGSDVNYSFEVESVLLGDAYEGGNIICVSGGTQWIVAPSSSEITRNWYSRNDANTRAQQVSGCTGWFVPSCGQLQNPGYTCNINWDSYTASGYWSNTQAEIGDPAQGWNFTAWVVSVANGGASIPGGATPNKSDSNCVRSFRCVSY